MVGSAIFAIVILAVAKLSLPTLFVITGVLNLLFGVFLYTKLNRYKNSMERADGDDVFL